MTIFHSSVSLAIDKNTTPYVAWYAAKLGGRQNGIYHLSTIIFTSSDNRSYDHDSCRCHGTPNQQTCIRPPRTCCHLPCPTTSGLWRIQCLPMQPICWQPAANRLIFMRDGLCPLCSIFSDLLPCIGCMLFDYGWYGIRRATNSKCIHVAIVLVDCIELTSNKMILLLIITQEEKQGGGLMPWKIPHNNQMIGDWNTRQ